MLLFNSLLFVYGNSVPGLVWSPTEGKGVRVGLFVFLKEGNVSVG